MKRICILLIGLLVTVCSWSQTITEVLLPQYISADGTVDPSDDVKVPFVCRLTLSGLTPNATYRYYNRFVTASSSGSSNGDGYYIIVKPSGDFARVTTASLSTAGRYGELTTNASGSYTGWFAAEPSNAPAFVAGTPVFVRIALNNGAGGTSVATRITASSSITVIGFGTTATDGSAIRSTAATAGTAKNFVMLYDDAAGAGRPVAGTYIESDGTDNSLTTGYAPFYTTDVETIDKTWGTILPNNLTNGVRKIAQYSLADGSELGNKTSPDGFWAKAGGGTVSTVNTLAGLTSTIVLDGNVVTLGASVLLPQTISFAALPTKTYGEADFAAGGSASSLLAVSYSSSNQAVATITGSTIHIVGAGTTDITATQTGNTDYQAATPVVQTLIVNKAALTITADNKVKVQGDPLPALTATYTGFVNSETSTALTTQPTIITTATATSVAGQYPITISGADAANYTISYVPGTLTVTAARQPQTISFAQPPAKNYGEADFSAGATASSGLSVTYASSDATVATIVNGNIHIVGAGTTTITASQAGSANFEAATDVAQLLTINKAALTIKADNKTKLIGQANPALTITYTGFVYNQNNTVLTSQPVISTTAVTASPVGDYPITVTGAIAANYAITHVNGTLTVSPLPVQTITFGALPVKKYGEAAFAPGATASSGLPVTYTSSNTNVAVIDNGQIKLVGAGTSNITAAQAGDAATAPAPNVVQVLTVQKVYLEIKADDKVKTEGQANPALTINTSGFVNGENLSSLEAQPVVTTTATASSLPGVYVITVSGATSPNYNIVLVDGRLTVQPPQGTAQNSMTAYCSAPGRLQVNLFTDTVSKAVVQLFDQSGTRLLNINVTASKGFNTWQFPVGNITPGLYYVRVAGSQFTLKEKVNIQ